MTGVISGVIRFVGLGSAAWVVACAGSEVLGCILIPRTVYLKGMSDSVGQTDLVIILSA